MATVPNYYYNSPAFADIGRNLASALAPPDIDKLRAREQNEWQFQYAQKKAQNEALDRANSEEAAAALGDMYELQRNPILGPDGKVDMKATERRAFELADIAMTKGKKDVRADVDEGLFNLSPTFARKRILQRNMLNAQDERLTRSLAGAINLAQVQGGIRGGLQDDQQAADMARLERQMELRLAEWQFRISKAAKLKGKKPITITKQLGNEILLGVMRREKAAGHKLTDEAKLSMVAEIAQDTQETQDPYSSTETVWKKYFPQDRFSDAPTQEVQEPGPFDNWFGNTDTFLKPQGNPGAAPADPLLPNSPLIPGAVDPNSLGGAAITPPPEGNPFLDRGQREAEMEAASRAAASAETAAMEDTARATPSAPRNAADQGTPPVSKLKEGVPRRFKSNGQVWELQNGKPVRRRDLEDN